MIFLQKPPDFLPKFEVVSCFCEYQDKILLLLRSENKPQGNTYGVPAGKMLPNETPLEAIIRELKEETQIRVKKEKITFLITVFVRFPEYDFTYHIFQMKLMNKPKVFLNPNEHIAFRWETPSSALTLPLIQDLNECIELIYLESNWENFL